MAIETSAAQAQSAAEFAVAAAIAALESVRTARSNGDWVVAADMLSRTVQAASHAVSSSWVAAKALDLYDR